MWKYTFLCLVALAALLPACVDEFVLDPPEGRDATYLIQARLSKGEPSVVEVTMQNLFAFEGGNGGTPVPTATVVHLLDEAGNSIRVPTVDLGFFRVEIPANDPTIAIATGSRYKLSIQLPDGPLIESAFSTLQPLPDVSNLRLDFGQREILSEDGTITLDSTLLLLGDVDLTIPGQTAAPLLRWTFNQSYQLTEQFSEETPLGKTCYISTILDRETIHVLDGRNVTTATLEGLPFYEGSRDHRFAENFYFTLMVESLDADAFTYWDNTRDLVERDGNIFDPVPGIVQTNFQNLTTPDVRLYGHFYAAELDTLRYYVSPEAAGSPGRFCPQPPPREPPEPDPVCWECLNALGSSLTPPHYW